MPNGMSEGEVFFILLNLGIIAGYTYAAVRIISIFPVRFITKFSGSSFFLLCGLGTHAEMVLHTWSKQNEMWGAIVDSPHMLLVHAAQALSIWVFVLTWMVDMQRLARERHTTEPASSHD